MFRPLLGIIRIPDSVAFFACGIRNPGIWTMEFNYNEWKPECKLVPLTRNPESRGAYHLHKPTGWKSCAKTRKKTIKFDVVGEQPSTINIQIS